jgi:hypothetical protein|nr:MAG TPA: hypothetical protein [Caudoviricetes sp.]
MEKKTRLERILSDLEYMDGLFREALEDLDYEFAVKECLKLVTDTKYDVETVISQIKILTQEV